MMSMSMYRMRKQVSPGEKPLNSVNRSNSVPLNLSDDAQEFMETVVGQSSIPEDRALATAQLADSIRSENQEFFCPMDESVELNDENRNDSSTKQHVSKLVEQQQHRQAALIRLEEFFLGDSSSSSSKVSPVTVRDAASSGNPDPWPPLKRNMFGHIIEESQSNIAGNCSQQHHRAKSVDWHGFCMDPDYDEVSSFSLKQIDSASLRNFTKLKAGDRAHSLPLEYIRRSSYDEIAAASVVTMTKKPSLKKISSIGQGMATKKVNSEGNLQRTVSFSSLSIREYPPAISDNPSCSFGPPVQLDWEFEAEATHPIDHYEESRLPRRASHDLLLSYYDRRFLLLKQAGYSRREVKEAMKEAERVKRERLVTDLFLPAQAFDETMENVVERVKNFFFRDKRPEQTR